MNVVRVRPRRRVRTAGARAVVGLLSLCVLSSSAGAADVDAVERFGQLPARFNGRLTTIETAAAAMLRRISGRDVFFDDQGHEHSAAAWYLREASHAPSLRTTQVLKIDDAELRALLKVEPRAAPGPDQHRYALDELIPALDALEAAEQQARRKPPSAFSEALDRLTSAFRANLAVRLSFREPAGSEIEQLQRAIAEQQELDSVEIPLLVPPQDDAGAWMSWGRGVLENAVVDVLKDAARTPIPTVPLLREVFAAYRADDDERFAKAVDAYAAYLKNRPPPPPAFDFEIPREWRELGTPVVSQAEFYDDTLTSGAPTARFVSDAADGSFGVRVLYFPGPTAPVERIVNQWRIGGGRAPLNDAALKNSLTPGRIGPHEAVAVELSDAAVLPPPPRSVRAVVLRRPQDALVVIAEGSPEAVAAERARLTVFLNSLVLGSPEAAGNWFRIVPAEPRNPSGLALLILTARFGDETWMFRVSGFGPLPAVGRAACLKFVAEFPASRFLRGGDRNGWAPPEGWRLLSDGGEPAEFQLGEGSEARYLAARPLVDFTADSEAPLVNHWRTFCGLPPWTEEEAAKNVRSEHIGNVEIRTVEILAAGPPEK